MSLRREQGAADHPFPLQDMKKKGKWSLTSKAVAVVGRIDRVQHPERNRVCW
jgi:hypothetical protein